MSIGDRAGESDLSTGSCVDSDLAAGNIHLHLHSVQQDISWAAEAVVRAACDSCCWAFDTTVAEVCGDGFRDASEEVALSQGMALGCNSSRDIHTGDECCLEALLTSHFPYWTPVEKEKKVRTSLQIFSGELTFTGMWFVADLEGATGDCWSRARFIGGDALLGGS